MHSFETTSSRRQLNSLRLPFPARTHSERSMTLREPPSPDESVVPASERTVQPQASTALRPISTTCKTLYVRQRRPRNTTPVGHSGSGPVPKHDSADANLTQEPGNQLCERDQLSRFLTPPRCHDRKRHIPMSRLRPSLLAVRALAPAMVRTSHTNMKDE